MFTVKHYKREGKVVSISGCDSYELLGTHRVELFTRGVGVTVIEVAPEESLFVENIAGKTITAIRPKD